MRHGLESLRNIIAGALFAVTLVAGAAPAVAAIVPATTLSAGASTLALEASAVAGGLFGFVTSKKKKAKSKNK